MVSESRHPLLADTSSLIAIANTDQWELLKDALHLTQQTFANMSFNTM